jgi:hypothetical protein
MSTFRCLALLLICAQLGIAALFSFNFNDGTYGVMEEENEVARSDAISIGQDPLNASNKCARFNVRATDTTSECDACQRAELKIYRKVFSAKMRGTYTYRARLMLANDWQFGGDRWQTLLQWHDNPYDASDNQIEAWRHPILKLAVLNTHWTIVWRWCGDAIQSEAVDQWDSKWQGQIDEAPNGRWWIQDASNDRGRWISWIFLVRWDYESTGLLRVWKDDVKVIDRNGPIGYNDIFGPTCKMGIYRSKRYSGKPYNGEYYDRTLYLDDYIVEEGDTTTTDEPPQPSTTHAGTSSQRQQPKSSTSTARSTSTASDDGGILDPLATFSTTTITRTSTGSKSRITSTAMPTTTTAVPQQPSAGLNVLILPLVISGSLALIAAVLGFCIYWRYGCRCNCRPAPKDPVISMPLDRPSGPLYFLKPGESEMVDATRKHIAATVLTAEQVHAAKATLPKEEGLPPNIELFYMDDGTPYYYNTVTGRSHWTIDYHTTK